ncbi:hypothetical protein EDC19_2311 [Natranaerovirga hydrolytica]|uniref:ABC-2 family transporter n=1 Tax=Natranaerovirga hydrolytica TaxID=680378 RepID=A0A4R1MFM5_9FIRM|nr:hypothetical protein [Natranaerovirga hydrolytica]TCK90542.1 hypothetical protein EDC19_2311 [Natranaerovirga hydrolytica]
MLCKVLKYDIKAGLNIKVLTSILMLFLVISYQAITTLETNSSIVDLYIILFGGLPNKGDANFLMILRWFILQIYLAFILGKFLHKEWSERSIYIIIRTHSRYVWLISKLIYSLLFTGIYYCIGMFSTSIIGMLKLEKSFNFSDSTITYLLNNNETIIKSPIQTIVIFFILQWLSIYVVCILQIILSLYIDKSIHVLVIISTLYFMGIKISQSFSQFAFWFIPYRGMFFMHLTAEYNAMGFNVITSFAIIIISLILTTLLSLSVIKNREFI